MQLKTIAAASVIISPWTPADGNFQTSPNTAVSSIVELLLTSSSIKGAYSIKLSPLTCFILKFFRFRKLNLKKYFKSPWNRWRTNEVQLPVWSDLTCNWFEFHRRRSGHQRTTSFVNNTNDGIDDDDCCYFYHQPNYWNRNTKFLLNWSLDRIQAELQIFQKFYIIACPSVNIYKQINQIVIPF